MAMTGPQIPPPIMPILVKTIDDRYLSGQWYEEIK